DENPMKKNVKEIDLIARVLQERKETLAIAESVTAGYLQTAISQANDASCFFQGGITAYNLGQKAKHLGIDPIHAETCNCVSIQTARQMALGAAALFSSQWGIGITGYATAVESIAIKRPFAFYAIAYGSEILVADSVTSPKPEGKNSQEYFARETLKLFSMLLKD